MVYQLGMIHCELMMYRCYLLSEGRIIWGEDLKASSLTEAIALGQKVRKASSRGNNSLGLEIWQGASLRYHDASETGQRQHAAPIVSPFDTAESTMYRTWQPTTARPLITQMMSEVYDDEPTI